MGTIVEKSEYLTETKDKIKESINDLGGNIDNTTTFREYAQELDNIYDNLPKTTGEGTNLSLNTLKGKMNIIPKGNIEQETTTGINLFKDIQTQTLNGVTLTNNGNGSYTLSGKATAWTEFRATLDSELPVGSYSIILRTSGQNNSIYEVCRTTNYTSVGNVSGGSSTGISVTNITTTSDKLIGVVGITVSDFNTTFSNFIIRPMLVSGTYTSSNAPNFEKYTDGIASPNPSFPSDIEVVTGTQEVVVSGKNLFDKDSEDVGHVYSSTGNYGTAMVWTTSDWISVESNIQYTLSWKTTDTVNMFFSEFDKNKKFIQRTITSALTPQSNTKYVRLSYKNDIGTYDIQIEQGSTATTYEPYQTPQTQQLSLGDIELCKIGNYQDYLYKSNDKWYKKEYIGKVVLNDSENISLQSINSYGIANFFISHSLGSVSNLALCNYFTLQTSGISVTQEEGFLWQHNGVYFRIKSSTASDVSSFKTWLNSHSVKVEYALANANDIEITNSSLIEQLDNIEKLKSYNGTTNISSSGNLPMVLNVSALKGE